ncbi:MAG: hypothetical protein ACKOJF_31195, partial [Planctomycetaceae bacterium]
FFLSAPGPVAGGGEGAIKVRTAAMRHKAGGRSDNLAPSAGGALKATPSRAWARSRRWRGAGA